MHRHFLPTGRVRDFPSCDHVGNGRFISQLTDASWQVQVRRKLVDTTYIEGAIPATSPPPFEVADGVRCVPAGDIARPHERPERYVVIGAGKTALDACVWLLERGVPAAAIRWIKPREAWWLNRRFQQPHTLVPELYRGASIQIEAMAKAASMADLFARLEADGILLRVDPGVTPTMFRGAVTSEPELALLRQIEDVVRLGYVRRIERDEIVLEQGRVATSPATLHVHCAASALARPPLRPIFEPGRITVQPFMWGFACFQFSLLGVIEAVVERDEDKNSLCPPIAYWDRNQDYLTAFLATLVGDRARAAHPSIGNWTKATRLNPVSGIAAYRSDPRVVEARERIKQYGLPAAINLQKLASGGGQAASTRSQ